MLKNQVVLGVAVLKLLLAAGCWQLQAITEQHSDKRGSHFGSADKVQQSGLQHNRVDFYCLTASVCANPSMSYSASCGPSVFPTERHHVGKARYT